MGKPRYLITSTPPDGPPQQYQRSSFLSATALKNQLMAMVPGLVATVEEQPLTTTAEAA
ncbi:MAG TPA: hypothetical protein VMV33_17465 [Rhodocyclaceae bacterium]|nr:hypothetical protein [Rhodocyclaceae bacterium]